MSREDIIEALRCRGLFRARDLDATGTSRGWLQETPLFSPIVKVARGVYRHPEYTPTRYELLQIRAPRAVFWGPSALWQQGLLPEEPALLWVALGIHQHPPKGVPAEVVVVRTRASLDTVVARRDGTALELTVQSPRSALEAMGRRLRRRGLARAERRALIAALGCVAPEP